MAARSANGSLGNIMPTKLVSRPTQNFVDSLISSIGGLYLTIISFAAVYCYVGFNQYRMRPVSSSCLRYGPIELRDARLRQITVVMLHLCRVPQAVRSRGGDRATALIENIWCEKIRGCSYREAVRPTHLPVLEPLALY
jgi:hypothetical protein